ncbi:MAG: rRNA adenine N-6-methyltransferase family protein [Pseudomonadota bacterium]
MTTPNFEAARVAMVDTQVRPSDVTLYPIIAAMLDVPRERFVPTDLRGVAYAGAHLPLARERVLLDPRVLAKMLDALKPEPTDLVLDIAPGTGYSTALLARLAAAVVAVEPDPDLARSAIETLAALDEDTALLQEGDAAAGAPEAGPFDAVFINGAIETLPDQIAAQVKPGGRIVAIFQDGAAGQCRLGTRTGDGSRAGIAWKTMFDATAPVLSGYEKPGDFVF